MQMKIINEFLKKINTKHLIFCDMDGVLTNFLQAVEDLGYGTFEELEKKGNAAEWKVVSKAGEKFWSDMPWMDDGKELWNFIKPHHPIILTAPTKSSKVCKPGKIKWVHKNLGSDIKILIIDAKDKRKYAHEHGILIDDMKRNIDQWNDDGGIGILHKSAKETIKKLKEILDV